MSSSYNKFEFPDDLKVSFSFQNTMQPQSSETNEMRIEVLNHNGDGYELVTKTLYNSTPEFEFNILFNNIYTTIYNYGDNKISFIKEIEIPTPINNNNPATKQYVDSAIGGVIAPTSVTLTGDVSGSGATGTPFSTTLNKTLNQISNDGDIDIASHKILNVLNPTTNQGAATKIYVDTKTWNSSQITDLTTTILSFRLDQFALPTNSVNFNSQKLQNVQTPTEPNEAANRNYVDTALAIAVGGMPIGSIAMWSTQTPPTGWLECNGSEINRLTYALLFAVIGVTFGSGNGSTTFNLPESRGLFPRGWNHSSTKSSPYKDPDASSRIAAATGGLTGDNIGTLQPDDYKAHTHTYERPAGSTTVSGVGSVNVATPRSSTNTGTSPSSGGSESRPVNFSVMFIIKAY